MRVGLHEGLDLGEELFAGGAQLLEHRGELGQDGAGGIGAGDHDGLFAQGGEDLGGPLRVRLERYHGDIASPLDRVGREPGNQ